MPGPAADADGFYASEFWGQGQAAVAWSFKDETRFFRAIRYKGNGVSGRAIPHGLGGAAGMVMIKTLANAASWRVWHKNAGESAGVPYWLQLNSTAARSALDAATVFPSAPTDTDIIVGAAPQVNSAGVEYIALVFAHSPDGNIQCGTYTGNGNVAGPNVDLGWAPQFLIIKALTSVAPWTQIDSARGFSAANELILNLDDAAVEASADLVDPTATGFQIVNTASSVNAAGIPYIYLAIRKPD